MWEAWNVFRHLMETEGNRQKFSFPREVSFFSEGKTERSFSLNIEKYFIFRQTRKNTPESQ
jgi:hypothetical protein